MYKDLISKLPALKAKLVELESSTLPSFSSCTDHTIECVKERVKAANLRYDPIYDTRQIRLKALRVAIAKAEEVQQIELALSLLPEEVVEWVNPLDKAFTDILSKGLLGKRTAVKAGK